MVLKGGSGSDDGALSRLEQSLETGWWLELVSELSSRIISPVPGLTTKGYGTVSSSFFTLRFLARHFTSISQLRGKLVDYFPRFTGERE